MHDPVPDRLRDFILAYIETVTDLEALLLLRRQSGLPWTVEAAAKALYVPADQAAAVLARLEDVALLVGSGGTWRYAPQTPELAATVNLLAETYVRALIPVTNLVHSNPRRLRRFADAFKFRKDS
jgi:hypothetical protein